MCLGRLKLFLLVLLACLILLITACDETSSNSTNQSPNKNLKVVIIRHGEKPATDSEGSDNLSCQGQNRATQLPAVLIKKIGKPDYTYVPALKLDKSTTHSRMFQTVTPFAVKYSLAINSKYEASDYVDIAKSVLKKNGTVLMVWSHSEMADLVGVLGINDAPKWKSTDFDSMWIVTYASGKAELTIDQEGLNPSANCGF